MTLEKLKEIHNRITDKYAEMFQSKARASMYGVNPNSERIKRLEREIEELEKLIKTEHEKEN